jgi:hypothetical protein
LLGKDPGNLKQVDLESVRLDAEIK